MHFNRKATGIRLFSLKSPQMRAFHMSSAAFFVCFFAWFGIAPLMAVVREELALTAAQVGNSIIASVAVTILSRLAIGWVCDRYGPRLAYSGLLILGSIPVICIGFAQSYESFLLFRLAIGAIGASFVITQYHTTLMFAPNVVGTANATTAGWGNLGGGVTQLVMPLIFSAFLFMGVGDFWSWRLSMVAAGVICLITGFAYFFLTQDAPEGNYSELRARGKLRNSSGSVSRDFLAACKDYRVWILFVIYGACFGVELTINNIAALYFIDYFDLTITKAGMLAALFGMMNIFARSLGGWFGDRFGMQMGLRGRVLWLFMALFCSGIGLIIFSQMRVPGLAIAALVGFSLFVQMSEGATFSVVPFINKKALGAVAGIVGAGGNMGAVAAGFLFRGGFEWPTALLILGGVVCLCSLTVPLVRFSMAEEKAARLESERLLREAEAGGALPAGAAA